ncbi:MAG: hypothetical protein O2877_01660 [bacterium]|nr:hypothetical protein [bacterium]
MKIPTFTEGAAALTLLCCAGACTPGGPLNDEQKELALETLRTGKREATLAEQMITGMDIDFREEAIDQLNEASYAIDRKLLEGKVLVATLADGASMSTTEGVLIMHPDALDRIGSWYHEVAHDESEHAIDSEEFQMKETGKTAVRKSTDLVKKYRDIPYLFSHVFTVTSFIAEEARPKIESKDKHDRLWEIKNDQNEANERWSERTASYVWEIMENREGFPVMSEYGMSDECVSQWKQRAIQESVIGIVESKIQDHLTHAEVGIQKLGLSDASSVQIALSYIKGEPKN